MKKTFYAVMLLLGLGIMLVGCNSGVKSEQNQNESVTDNKKEDKPSECVVSFHMDSVDVFSYSFDRMKFKTFSCNMYSGSNYIEYGNSDMSTCDIVVPEGQRWAYKDYNVDYKSDKMSSWMTRPFIILKIGDTKKKYQLPEEGRDVVFYPGDVIRIGTYLYRGHFDYVDVSVVFFVNYN